MKTNGSGNGHDPDHKDDTVLHFPSLAERQEKIRLRMQKNARAKPAAVPFFNLKIIPPFTRVLVLSFILVQIALALIPDDLAGPIVYTFGFVPGYFTGTLKPFPVGAAFSPLTHIFIHGGWMHLAFNTVMTVTLCMFFEREFGTRRAIVFFFVSALCGALLYFALNPFSPSPMIGASGGISGLFGALIIIVAKRGGLGSKVRSPWPLIAFWVFFLMLTGMFSGDSTAWQTHIGGFLGGIALLHLMQSGRLKI
jgi:membrane associated rhomboid family serine protease